MRDQRRCWERRSRPTAVANRCRRAANYQERRWREGDLLTRMIPNPEPRMDQFG
jgi:hypothetical protein